MSTRLRAINGAQRPQSSMGTGPSPVTRNYRDEPREERSNKRTRHSEPNTAAQSRYFARNPQPQPEKIEDEGLISTKHTRPVIHDLTREVSRAISVDGSSVTSNSKTAAATSGLQEYRNVYSQNTVKHGRRRRKQSSTKPTSSPIELDDTNAVKHKNLPPPQPSHTVTSPDHLATIIDDDDPPLTNIISDIPLSKRQAPEYAQSAAKRYKLANGSQINSDDELSLPGTSAGRETGKKLPNFSKLISQSSSQSRPQRGDIQLTLFKPTTKTGAERRNMAPNEPALPEPMVIGASCGRVVYPSGNNLHTHVQLRLGTDAARLAHEEDKEFSWLEVHKRTVNSIKHSNTKSPVVIVHRSVVGPAGSPLALKFSSKVLASYFIQWLHGSTVQFEQCEPSWLESAFNHQMGTAKHHVEQLAKPHLLVSPNNAHNTTLPRTEPLSPARQDAPSSSNSDFKINLPGNESPSARQDVPVSSNSAYEVGPPRLQPRLSHRDPFMGEPRSPGPSLVPEPEHEPRPTKLKDRMQGVPQPKEGVHMELSDTEDTYAALTRTRGPETRRTRRSSPPSYRQRTPETWTVQNPGWDKDWHRSLVYPPTGKNRATVDKDDIQRLDEGEFLNDNLISFYLRYLQVQLEKERPEILKKVYIFNTFFFEKLRSNRAKINYDGVKSWTARIDLLSYEYIVVPVNENAHWYLAIIYNAPRLLPQEVKAEASTKKEPVNPQELIVVEDNDPAVSISDGPSTEQAPPVVSGDTQISRSTRSRTVNGNGGAVSHDETVTNTELPVRTSKRKSTSGNQKFSTDEPRIITLDSLGAAHSPTCKCLRDYLVEEARHKKGIEIAELPGGMTARNIPEQDNYCDCGVFILGYMEHFLKDPDEAVRRLLHKEATNWHINAPRIRAKVRDLLFDFQHEQHMRLEEEKEKKRQRRATKGPVSSPQVAPSSPQVPQKDPETPQVKRGLKSPLTNGTNIARQGEPHQAGTISAYFEVVPPERPAQPQTPKRNEEPPLVRPLEEDSGNESKASSSGEVFHSARSSPVNSVPQVPSGLTTERHVPRDGQTTPKQPSTPNFVNKLSASSNDSGPPTASSTIKKHSSPVDLTKEHHPLPPRAQGSEGAIDLRSIVMESIEDDKPPSKGPQYDGIDRSIDLTAT
ncbi:hypothetical protein FSARC_2370 [Fusarium sarcochroum]|uniref:Ubiquitin-like protease family profile domain-containing protein n=1 Tax=Fusarium sarcochroum TaxID=1208366 RepID=A0A8H4U6R6_9HYPO|nr:hypothetical protein FSARC_2370 [Fusarium sarcochroum]